ncbi:MAG TPA: glycoside hydrolase N-terminal domain-containing protein [Candidatus Onthovicinus excrementipullorum]|nr:glycoside hydrolase N-terminal domain-containing protein [Candidatus Onthovicinus excrementipullorum]
MIHPSKHTIEYTETIRSWDEGIPLGNGDIGAIIWSASDRLRLSIDKGDIWDCSYRPQDQPDFTYRKLTEFARTGKMGKIHQIYDKNGYGKPAPTKLPVGKIVLNLGVQENVKSVLDLTTAQAELNAGKAQVNAFIAANERVGYIRVNSPKVRVHLENPEFGSQSDSFLRRLFTRKPRITASMKNLRYPAPETGSRTVDGTYGQAEQHYFVQRVSEAFLYATIVRILRSGEESLIVYTVVSTHDGEDVLKHGERLLSGALAKGYDTALAEHKEWWADYWAKSAIDLPDPLLEKSWYVGNYLLASCSRKGFHPMPLQGLWTADNGELPPWKGDYHHDLNTQLCYQSYGKANHLDEGACFIDYLMKLAPQAEKFARTYYGTDGLCLPAVMDIRGEALGGWAMYSLSPTNQLWLCDIIFRHYEYTRDRDFLREQAYPYVAKSMQNIIELLEERGGKYYLPWSSSPEIHDCDKEAFMRPNTNYDLSLMRAALSGLIRYAESAGRPEDAEKYQKILNKLDPLAVSPDHVLMLDSKERLAESHRHHSHAMAIFPLRLLNYDWPEDRMIIDATIADLEKLGTRNWCGYSFAWMAQFYCVQRNGEKAARILNQFWRYFCLKNGFHVNGDYMNQGLSALTYRPFTLEGTFCALSAIQEMLLYCENGVVEPLRAVPESWRDIEFENLRGMGGILVSVKYHGGAMQYLSLQAAEDQEIELVHHFQGSFRASGPFDGKGSYIAVTLQRNQKFEIWAE